MVVKISVSFVFMFIMLAFSGFYFVSASEVSSDFTVDGCFSYELPSGNNNVANGTCSSSGHFYCDSSSVLKDTSNEGDACKMEAVTFNEGDPQCCPAGYECLGDDNGGSVYRCNAREDNCGDYVNNNDVEGGCSFEGCFWIGATVSDGFCVSRPLDYSCSVYDTPEKCTNDAWNLGQEGFGATACNKYSADNLGKNYVAPQGECGCSWNDNFGRCEFEYDVQEDIYASGMIPNSFTCNKNFSSSACIDDFQEVTWNVSIDSGILNFPDSVLKSSSECISGSERRACGEPVIKLPGFSLFALISSIAIISMFYAFKREED